jgi:hypothetical protein
LLYVPCLEAPPMQCAAVCSETCTTIKLFCLVSSMTISSSVLSRRAGGSLARNLG